MTKTHELKIAPEEERNLDRKTTEELGEQMNSTSLKEMDIINVHSEDLTATIQRYLDLGYLCDVKAFHNKGYMEPEYKIVILKKE
ncbi:hypothetical protein K7S03_001819 [Listeria monocytogenes]|nr:hypothetical protein [Listeria monocytogenes]